MRRSLQVATVLFACAAAAPGCLIDGSPFDTTGGGGTAGSGLAGPGGAGAGGSAGGGGTSTVTTGGGGTGGTPEVCGDGKKTGSEKCDDGNTSAGDGCDATCQVEDGYVCVGEPSMCEQTCGDGMISVGVEQCDDKDLDDGDGCSDCEIDPGYLCTGEPSVCVAACGNGVVDINAQNTETCDDANMVATDGCDQCVRQPGWDCMGEPSVCKPACGDSMVVGPEPCDDGPGGGCKDDCSGPNPGYGCNAAGVCTPVCGDGLAIGGEGCDDGGTAPGDGCSAACQPEKTCGNGIVEPTEQCDSPTMTAVCDAATCLFKGTSVCGSAIVITPADPDAVTGVRTSFYENLDSAAIAVAVGEVPAPTCVPAFNLPVLHRYTTGNRPSIVTFATLDKMKDGSGTFGNTVLWAYRDCFAKSDLAGCDNDSGLTGKRSLLQTGYIPAQTTLFVAISGEGGGGDKGKYNIKVTEQPVKLFFYESFGPEATPGAYPFPASLMLNNGGDGGWKTCVPGGGSPCGASGIKSHSGGALGFADGGAGSVLTNAVASTPTFNFSSLSLVRASYSYGFVDASGGGDFARAQALDNGVAFGTARTYAGTNNISADWVDLPKTASSRADFIYNDNSQAGGSFSIDDLYIYGY